MTQTATRKQTEIQSAVVFRCVSKVTGEIFYAVKSDSSDQMYQVTFNAEARRYECNCPACSECKHLRAIRSVVLAKAETRKQEITSPAQAENENEVVSVKVGDVTVCSSRKHIANAVEHTKWSQEMAAYARAKDAERARARTATPDEVAAVEEVKAEAKMAAFQQGMDEQYAAEPRQGLSQGERETAISNMRHLYDEW